jgi:hypothetical protein
MIKMKKNAQIHIMRIAGPALRSKNARPAMAVTTRRSKSIK